MKKPIILACLISILSGCYDAPDKLKPMPWIFNMMPKNAPNNYKKGWRDGCESGLGNMTNAYYKTFYTFRQDPKLRENATYYSAWKDTFNFCRHYAYGTLRQSNQRFDLPGVPNEVGPGGGAAGTAFMGADGGMLSNAGLLHLWGPVDWLVPFQKVGHIGGDPWIAANGSSHNVAGTADPTTILGGQSEMDFSSGYQDFGMGAQGGMWASPNMTWDFSNVPFFGATDAWK